MKDFYKPHIRKMNRYQTSLGRDLDAGTRLDRNEKVSDFPKEVIDTIFSKFKRHSLSASPESDSLYKKIARSIDISERNIFVSSGITEGIRVLYDFCTQPGDNVICLDPTYPMYSVYAEMYQVEYRKFTYDTNTLRPDLRKLYDQIDENTKFVFIPNPNLPIESCFSVAEISEILQLCINKNIMLVIDEAYHYFGAPSVLSLVSESDNIIIFRTFSKAYGLAGLRIGFMVSDAKNIDYFSKSRSIVESNTLSMGVAEYFLEHPELRDAHVAEVKTGSEYLQKELTRLGLKWYGGNLTNGLLFFLHNKKDSDQFVSRLREKKIYVRGAFEAPFEATVRVSIGPVAQMKAFISELESFLKSK